MTKNLEKRYPNFKTFHQDSIYMAFQGFADIFRFFRVTLSLFLTMDKGDPGLLSSSLPNPLTFGTMHGPCKLNLLYFISKSLNIN